ncbi:hypothetical protein D3C85_1704440 [compost metagenome]
MWPKITANDILPYLCEHFGGIAEDQDINPFEASRYFPEENQTEQNRQLSEQDHPPAAALTVLIVLI